MNELRESKAIARANDSNALSDLRDARQYNQISCFCLELSAKRADENFGHVALMHQTQTLNG